MQTSSEEHVTEPLDYLYEELPPERMAEVRKHLAECSECRLHMRQIRETVKVYRQTPHPRPPADLADRVAAIAIEEADQGAVGLMRGRHPAAAAVAASLDQMIPTVPEPRETRQARLEDDFGRLKEELRGEMRTGWKSWFFHPGWAVAASTLFICSLLIHFSPRWDRMAETPIFLRENVPVEGAARRIRERERIPESQPRVAMDVPSGETPPILHEAKVWQEPFSLPPAPAVAAAPAQNDGMRAASPGPRKLTLRPGILRSPESAAACPPREVGTVRIARAARNTLYSLGAKPDANAVLPRAYIASPPVPAQKPETMVEKMIASSESVETTETGEESTSDIVILDMLKNSELPELIARPTPVDVQEAIRNLTTLVGMQMANGEIADAWQTLAMLRRYDENAADKLSLLLTEVEKSALASSADTDGAATNSTDADALVEEPVPASPIQPATAGAIEAIPDSEEIAVPDTEEPSPAHSSLRPSSKYEQSGPDAPVAPAPSPEASSPVTAPGESEQTSSVPPTVPTAPAFPGAMVEPPEDPPMSLVRVPPSMRQPAGPPPQTVAASTMHPAAAASSALLDPLPATSIATSDFAYETAGVVETFLIVPTAESTTPAFPEETRAAIFRSHAEEGRAAALAQTLSQALQTIPVAPMQPVGANAYEPTIATAPQAVVNAWDAEATMIGSGSPAAALRPAAPVIVYQAPATPVPTPRARPFSTDPYLRDY